MVDTSHVVDTSYAAARLWQLAAVEAPGPARREPADGQLAIELFDELRGRLLGYLLALGLPAEDGEELVQEAFLALFQHLRLGRSRANLRGWLFRVVHNLGLKRRRLRGREALAACVDNLANTECDPAENPEQQLLRGRKQQRLSAIVRALPEQDRCCLALRGEGLRYREIAAVLGISLGSVAVSLARSIAKLKAAG